MSAKSIYEIEGGKGIIFENAPKKLFPEFTQNRELGERERERVEREHEFSFLVKHNLIQNSRCNLFEIIHA